MKKYAFIFILSFVLVSCSKSNKDFGIATPFYPSIELLEKGLVNKYYCHTFNKGDQDTSIHIRYHSYKFVGNKFHVDSYVNVYNKEAERVYEFKDDKYILLKSTKMSRIGDITVTAIQDSVSRNWGGQEVIGKRSKVYSWGNRIDESQQLSNFDTTFIGLEARGFRSKNVITFEAEKDTNVYNFDVTSIYAKGLGSVYYKSENEETQYWEELVEQIDLDKFLAQGNTPMHRIGYIDTLEVMDRDTPFVTCEPTDRIHDYYNDSKSLHYKNGKRAVWNIVDAKLDQKLLGNESGYLTFRFVVNCKGEAGRFITEEADLDFQPKSFNENTVTHFYEILRGMEDWIPTKSWGEIVDAYAYLTFKLENGKLIEILP